MPFEKNPLDDLLTIPFSEAAGAVFTNQALLMAILENQAEILSILKDVSKEDITENNMELYGKYVRIVIDLQKKSVK